MRLGIWIGGSLLGVGVLGGGGYFAVSGLTGGYQTKFNETNAVAQLRQYQVAQYVYRQEREGRFAETLGDLAIPGLVDKPLGGAWNRAASPEPFRGYLFADIPGDPRYQCGLCAYPESPGRSGRYVYVILLDESRVRVSEDGRPLSTDEIQIWMAPCDVVQGPVTSWPSPSEVAAHWTRFDRAGAP